MSEEKKAVELKDEELEKVSGGMIEDIPDIPIDVRRYCQGSVFIFKPETNRIAVLPVVINTAEYWVNPDVSYVSFFQFDGEKRWNYGGNSSMPMRTFFETYQYSAELTAELSGKLNY